MRKLVTTMLTVVLIGVLVSCGENKQNSTTEIVEKDVIEIKTIPGEEVAEALDLPDDFIKKYNEYMTSENVSKRLEEKFSFQTRQEGWEKFSRLYESKKIVEINDIESICFDTSSDEYEVEYKIITKKPRTDYIVEPNSYWPERKLGQFVLTDVKPPGNEFMVLPDFLMTIQRFLYNTLAYTTPTAGNLLVEPINFSQTNFFMIPLSEEIWCIFAILSENNYYSDNITTYCFIKIEETKLSQEKLTQLTDWIDNDVMSWSNFKCVVDVNLDGYLDIICQHNGVSGTTDTTTLSVYTCVDEKFFEITIEGENIRGFGYFEGIVGGYPQFKEKCIGCGPWRFSTLLDDGAIRRYSPFHKIEVRENGELFDVTYRNPINLDPKKIEELIASNHHSFSEVDALGHTRKAQKKFLENLEPDKEQDHWEQIIQECYNKGVPWHVQSENDIPAGWDVIRPWR
jgi:hypothetical protein